jgi:chemotaxis protein MotB
MAKASEPPIVIKKIKRVSGGGHHGGAWKVAYADFVTAMMAFFLLMWLINTTTPEQKRGIADYFAPASVSQSNSGSGGLLAGTALATEGARHHVGSPLEQNSPRSTPSPTREGQEGSDGSADPATQADLQEEKARRSQDELERAEVAIRQALQDLPELAELSKQVLIENTPEGLRIQLVDQEGRSMFAPGASRPNERATRLLSAIVGPLLELPNRVSISGHTDGEGGGAGLNWALSAARADSTRSLLQELGVPSGRMYQVSGRADADPLFPDDPTLPGNRRVVITLLREAPVLPPGHSL